METPAKSVRGGLTAAGRILKASAICQGLMWWLVVSLGAWLGLFLLDNLLRLPAGLRLPLALGGGLLAGVGLVLRVGRPSAARQRVERTARVLERQYSVRDNLLINACHFETQALSSGEAVFAGHTIDDSDALIHRIPTSALWDARRLRRWGFAALLVLAGWLVYGITCPRHVGNAFARYASPLSDIPPVGSVTLQVIPSSDTAVREGDDLRVRATVSDVVVADGDVSGEPRIVWLDGSREVGPSMLVGQNAAMRAVPGAAGMYDYTFQRVRRAFSFRVFAGDTYSRSVSVAVRPLPRIRSSVFRLHPPAYTALPSVENPGPPASVAGLPGTVLEIDVEVDRPVGPVQWRLADHGAEFTGSGGTWTAKTQIEAAGAYTIEATDPSVRREVLLAKGEVGLAVDRPPQVDFTTEDRNRFINPGAKLTLELRASDDFGVRKIDVTARRAEDEAGGVSLRAWAYMGPPGNKGPLRERLTIEADPAIFVPGEAYLVEAWGWDFSPGGLPGRSRPVVLRVKTWEELQVHADDPFAAAFEVLKRTVVEQRKANGMTDNFEAYLEEALAEKRIGTHREALRRQQGVAHNLGNGAIREFGKVEDGAHYVAALKPLVQGEMKWVLNSVGRIPDQNTEDFAASMRSLHDYFENGVKDDASERLQRDVAAMLKELEDPDAQRDLLKKLLRLVEGTQDYILRELIALLGRFSGERLAANGERGDLLDETTAPPLTAEDALDELKDDLEEFSRDQRKLIDKSMTLMDKGPDDLTEEEEEILGDLAREEAKWAKFFEEKLTDFSKLPLQDFADGSIADEFNEVLQEVKLAAKSLYEKNVELAVPQEQAGLEAAEELVHNLEKWLPDTPDNQKWLMEEPPAPADIPLAELPAELEDIVGELLDKEEEMTEDVEDVTSSWMDSMDKGAGWDAMDGPISDMSAKGVTGNRLPNEMEIGGRAGEGRTGRSHGQMVESAAEGKGGRETPTRLTPSPFEEGSIEDASKESPGGSTGGGKLSGFTGEGLRGPSPTPRTDEMSRLSGQQAQIRQDAEALALKLRAYHLPSGDLEVSINSMQQFEAAVARADGLGVRRAFSEVLDALTEARKAIRSEVGLHREYSQLSERARDEIMTGLHDRVPKGYEEMIAAYFRTLAERGRAAPGSGE